MKNFTVLLVAIILACFSCDTGGSASIRKEISKTLNGTESTFMKLFTIQGLRFDLARAYIEENRPDEAIEILMELIEDNRNQSNFMGDKMNMSSVHYTMEKLYYETLTAAYQLKSDTANSVKAVKKSIAAAETAARLKPIEAKRDAAREKKKRDAILN